MTDDFAVALYSAVLRSAGVSDQVQVTAIATVLAALIAGGAAIATQRSAAAAAVRNQSVSSRTDIEKEAFERAKSFYTDTIDRQDRMIAARDGKIGDLETKVETLEGKVEELERELHTAHAALRLRFPDEG